MIESKIQLITLYAITARCRTCNLRFTYHMYVFQDMDKNFASRGSGAYFLKGIMVFRKTSKMSTFMSTYTQSTGLIYCWWHPMCIVLTPWPFFHSYSIELIVKTSKWNLDRLEIYIVDPYIGCMLFVAAIYTSRLVATLLSSIKKDWRALK